MTRENKSLEQFAPIIARPVDRSGATGGLSAGAKHLARPCEQGQKIVQGALDVLFVGEHAVWPLDQGFCVHGYHMAWALSDLGLRVGMASPKPLPNSAPKRLRDMSIDWPGFHDEHLRRFLHGWRGIGSWARRRLARYQGRNLKLFSGVIPLIDRHRPSVVIGLGQHSPMMLQALRDSPNIRRIWYAADEPVFFQLSCMRREPISQWRNRLSKMALYSALEGLFVRRLNGAIGVNPTDTLLLKRFAGVRHAATIRNGVDTDRFRPDPLQRPKPRSLVFWGRMDFEPNIDAVLWFAQHVWPTLKQRRPNATWQIVGKNPHPKVIELSKIPGVEVVGAVEDIRPYAHQAAITILPMRCGGGIKNKLLEAAAMGRPIVASPKALQGLELDDHRPPVWTSRTGRQWIEGILRLWSDAPRAMALGRNARAWVQARHTWQEAARSLVAWVGSLPAPRHTAAQSTPITTGQENSPSLDSMPEPPHPAPHLRQAMPPTPHPSIMTNPPASDKKAA